MAESKGPSGAGIQQTDKGPVQGVVLVGSDGRPFDVIVDGSNVHRLAVDSTMTLGGDITVDLDSSTDSVSVGNVVGSDTLFVESDGSIDTRLLDGAGNAISSDARGATRALAVELVDASGNQIVTFGGGTEYDEGDNVPSITGSALLVRDSADDLIAWEAGPSDTHPGVEITNATIEKTVGSAAGSLVLAMGGTDGTDARMIKTDADGNLQIDVLTAPTTAVTGTFWQATQPISASSLPLPSGASTSAKQDTIIGYVDGIETVLGTIDADTSAIAGCVGGTEIQVDIVSSALPVGAATESTLGDIKTAVQLIDNIVSGSGANISQINGVTPLMGSGATGTGSLRVTAATDSPEVTSLAIIDNCISGNEAQVDVITMPGIVGTVADDATTPGNPVMIGGKAVETDGTDPGQVSTEDDVAICRTDRQRRLLVNDICPYNWSVSADYSSAQTNTSVKASPGAGLKLYITDIFISNGATAGNITLLNGSGGTVMFEAYCAINGGAVLNLRTPIVLSAATALCITSTTVTTHAITVCGYTAP